MHHPRAGEEHALVSGDLSSVTTIAIQARHAHNLLRLARVNAALSARDEYEAKPPLPPARRTCPAAG